MYRDQPGVRKSVSGNYRLLHLSALLVLLALGACSSTEKRPLNYSPVSTASSDRRPAEPLLRKRLPQPATKAAPGATAGPAAQSTPPAVAPPRGKDSTFPAAGRLLPPDCVVLEASPSTLLVKRVPPAEPPSLFEESIALSKLRGLLASKANLPRETPQKTKLQNGTATIPFSPSVSEAELADVVAEALTLDGIQRIRAVWSAK